MSEPAEFDDEGTLVVEQHFAIVPEWVIDADISDAAYRLYSVLLRFGQSSGTRMPSRATLARKLRKKSTDSVDRAMKELVRIGAVVVERRRRGRENLTNRYHVRSTPPRRPVEQAPQTAGHVTPEQRLGGRTDAATAAQVRGGRNSAARGGRANAARVAAGVRQDPGVITQTPPPPSPPEAPVSAGQRIEQVVIRHLGDVDLGQVVDDVRAARRGRGLPVALWDRRSIAWALHESIVDHGRPPEAAVPALLAVAADPGTTSPARLPYPGPWWNAAEASLPKPDPAEGVELAELEARLAEADGRRVGLQREARALLQNRGERVTQFAVFRLACELLDRKPQAVPLEGAS